MDGAWITGPLFLKPCPRCNSAAQVESPEKWKIRFRCTKENCDFSVLFDMESAPLSVIKQLQLQGKKMNKNKMDKQLKPCPCCGGQAKFIENARVEDIENIRLFYVDTIYCKRCEFEIRQNPNAENGFQSVIDVWNRRFEGQING